MPESPLPIFNKEESAESTGYINSQLLLAKFIQRPILSYLRGSFDSREFEDLNDSQDLPINFSHEFNLSAFVDDLEDEDRN